MDTLEDAVQHIHHGYTARLKEGKLLDHKVSTRTEYAESTYDLCKEEPRNDFFLAIWLRRAIDGSISRDKLDTTFEFVRTTLRHVINVGQAEKVPSEILVEKPIVKSVKDETVVCYHLV